MNLRRILAAGIAGAATAGTASAYLTFGVPAGGRTAQVRWNRIPIRYFVTDRGAAGVTATQVEAAVSRAARTWESVVSAAVTFEFVGFVGGDPSEEDGVTTIGFEPRPELDRTLGATSFLIDEATGEIVEADIFFNTSFSWSVAPAGEANRFDLESVAAHEIGHLIGLGHSALGETELRPDGTRRVIAAGSILFPIAFSPGSTVGRALRPDDVAGVSGLYPGGDFRSTTGSIGGRVVRDGEGVFGAHVVAFNIESGDLVAGFSVNQRGEFSIAGLRPGSYLLRVEPLDDVEAGDVFEEGREVDTDFAVTFHEQVVPVPSGGAAPGLEIRVDR